MYVALLGRQPELSMAEIERFYGASNVSVFSSVSALIETTEFDIQNLGGSIKAGLIINNLATTDWTIIENSLLNIFDNSNLPTGKITFGISVYGLKVPAKTVEKTGYKIKSKLKTIGRSARQIISNEPSLSTATSHHNKLGLSANKIEMLILKGFGNNTIIASSVGTQNISAYARRDQGRPKRDPFVGMLPPKLAQMMINMASGDRKGLRLLDPFCGTGVILQEAYLLGHKPFGSDLSEKMVEYSIENLKWLSKAKHLEIDISVSKADATTHLWKKPIDTVATETYLGQPFSAPPSKQKLNEVMMNCNHIISSFLKNVAGQTTIGTPMCVAVPAWRDSNGELTHLPLIKQLGKLGFTRIELKHVDSSKLAYFREDQIVAREILLIERSKNTR